MSEPRTIEVARSWLERCSRDHSTCSPPESLSTAIAPSRIIRVDANANSSIQLIQTVDLAYKIQYVALSYCWGGDQLGKTLKSNVNRRKMPFSLFGPAKSIRDAVQVVRELGFSYLWVDSLCIIQDDQKDLATELSRMSDIYEQATLTISAAKSGTSTEGFLNPRSQITISNACGYRCPDGQIGIIQLQSPKKKSHLEPIHRRCWTLQEHGAVAQRAGWMVHGRKAISKWNTRRKVSWLTQHGRRYLATTKKTQLVVHSRVTVDFCW